MADDEGAAYWESVYGQPIHVYANEKTGPEGELERMTDEEYAAHVRQKMWEKTHAGLLEERARREELKRKSAAAQKNARRVHREMEDSLRRGEERRERKRWESLWRAYADTWAEWDMKPESMVWPLEGGRRSDISETAVRRFFEMGLDKANTDQVAYGARLKEERVRWHPDKMQQRLGGQADEEMVKDATAVFQIIDHLWDEMRSKSA